MHTKSYHGCTQLIYKPRIFYMAPADGQMVCNIDNRLIDIYIYYIIYIIFHRLVNTDHG